MSVPFGLDLGNNNSVIACARNRGIDVIVNEVLNRATPTLVGFAQKARAIGETGKTQQTLNLKNTVENVKRFIGLTTAHPDFPAEKKFLTVALEDLNGEVSAAVRFNGEKQSFTATQLYAMYLNKIKATAAKEVSGTISDICLAVPLWYTEQQRRAAVDAAKIAGLNPVRTVNEVTAAAVGYGVFKTDLPEDAPKTVAFVDVGHSSYTVSIVLIKKGELKVIGSAYDKHFGGRDFDVAIAEHFATEFKGKYKIDIHENPKAYSRVLAAAEKMKKVLSANTSAPISIESLMNDVDVSLSLTREELEELVAPLLARAAEPITKALAAAGIEASAVDSVEVIGGCSRVPALKTTIAETFGKPLSFTLNQDEAIARGAAFICAMHSPTLRVRPFKFEDYNPYTVLYFWDKQEEDVDHMEVFPRGGSFPATKVVTLHRTGDFKVEARYTKPEELPTGTSEEICLWEISGVDASAGSIPVKVKLRNDPSGFYTIEEAYSVEEKEFQEELPKAEDAEEDAEPEYKTVKKWVKKDVLTVVEKSYALPEEKVAELFEVEGKLVAQDKLVADTEDRKNALEEYIYELRGKLEDQYAAFASEAEKEKLSGLLMKAEDWLYDEGFDSTKARYIAKYEELASIGNMIRGRFLAAEEEKKGALREKLEAKRQAEIMSKLANDRKKDAEGDVKMD